MLPSHSTPACFSTPTRPLVRWCAVYRYARGRLFICVLRVAQIVAGLWEESLDLCPARELPHGGREVGDASCAPNRLDVSPHVHAADRHDLTNKTRFHYDTAAGGGLVQPCEAAYIACLDAVRGGSAQAPVVNVLVLYVPSDARSSYWLELIINGPRPSNLETMKRVYAGLPGVQVKAMHFTSADISAQRLLSIMKVDGTGVELYSCSSREV